MLSSLGWKGKMANSPTYDALFVTVRHFVAEATGMLPKYVIPANDNAPAPNTFYATVLPINIRMEGLDSEVARDNDGDDTKSDLHIAGNRIGTFSVQFYRILGRDNPGELALKLLAYPTTSVGQIYMAENNITWRKHGDILDIAAIMGSKFEERKGVDIEIGWMATNIDIVNALASAEITVNLDADGVEYQETLEVTE